MNASTTAKTICTALPQLKAVATAIPTTSPIAQPVRQCVVAETAARLSSCSACACKTLDCGEQLLTLTGRLLGVARGERVGDAVVDVVVEEFESETLERRADRRDLRQD